MFSSLSQIPQFHSKTLTLILDMVGYDSRYCRFVARRAGLAGKTDLEFVQADMVGPLLFLITDDLLPLAFYIFVRSPSI